MTGDSCQADLAELEAKLNGKVELLIHQGESLKELLEERDKFLKELIERNASEADSNHRQLRGLIELNIDSLRKESITYREKSEREIRNLYDEIRTLREGRSTDKGRMLGQEPWLKLVFYVLGGLLLAAALAFFAGRNTAPTTAPATNGARR